MLLVSEFHVCLWRGTVITLLQFFFSFVNRFLQDFNKVVDYYYYYFAVLHVWMPGIS